MFIESVDIQQTESLSYYNEHVPISVSVCINVSGFTKAEFFCEECVSQLLEKFIKYLLRIQDAVYTILNKKYEPVSFDGNFKDVYCSIISPGGQTQLPR